MLTPIKTIAGEVLLYFYFLQRNHVTKLIDTVISFQLRHLPENLPKDKIYLQNRGNSILNINKSTSYSDEDLYNSLRYLHDQSLIVFNESSDNCGESFLNLRVTSIGIDLIEGIERGEEEQKQFNTIFNIKLENNVTIESLLKLKLGSLIKTSLF